MDPVLKNKWLDALRSGKYQQIRRTLCDGQNGYCCLGVLADVCEIGQWDESGAFYHVDGEDDYGDPNDCWAELSDHVLTAIDLDHADQSYLITLNDSELRDFTEIADWIEENL